MDRILRFTGLTLIIAVVASCTKKGDETVDVISHGKNTEFHINTYKINDSLDVKLSDFAWDFEFIRLENSEGGMISYGIKDYVNDEYYLTELMRGDIYQFGRDGRFIRRIVTRGKGPTEFVRGNWTVDDENQVLYLCDIAKDNYFLSFDLKTGEYLGELKKAIPGRTYYIEYTHEGLLMVVPTGKAQEGKNAEYVYYQDLEGNKIRSVPAPGVKQLLYNNLTYSSFEDQYRLSISNNDTIFSIVNDQIVPYLTFDFGIENPPDRLMMGHIDVRIHKEVESYLILDVGTVARVTKNQDGQVIDLGSKVSYWVLDKKEGKAYHRGKLFIDPTFDEKGWWITFCKNGWFVKPYDAFNLMEKAEEALKDPDFKEPYRSKFKDLVDNLSEDDNQVLLVGRYK